MLRFQVFGKVARLLPSAIDGHTALERSLELSGGINTFRNHNDGQTTHSAETIICLLTCRDLPGASMGSHGVSVHV